ncbi:472_t:CDS:1, partial [Cetraspora pellucida]
LRYQNTNFKSFHYYLPVLEVAVSTKQLPCRYSTKKIPSLINCDLYNTSLKNHYKAEVFICEYGYYIICYNAMEEK